MFLSPQPTTVKMSIQLLLLPVECGACSVLGLGGGLEWVLGAAVQRFAAQTLEPRQTGKKSSCILNPVRLEEINNNVSL